MPADRRARQRIVAYRAEEAEQDGLLELRYESVADALHFACRDLRSGRRRPVEILEDGRVVYDAARIREAFAREQADIDSLLDDTLDQTDQAAP